LTLEEVDDLFTAGGKTGLHHFTGPSAPVEISKEKHALPDEEKSSGVGNDIDTMHIEKKGSSNGSDDEVQRI
jgi:hypothetical protein